MLEILESGNKFYIKENDNIVGEIYYEFDDMDRMVATHTYVNPKYRGQGIAGMLLKRLVEHARKMNKKIVPVCSYVLKAFEQNEEYQDIWYKND